MAQAAYTDSEKTGEVTISVPFITNGKVLQPGTHKLPASIVEDLQRRQYEYDQDQKKLLKDNGQNIDAAPGGIKG